MQIHLLAVGNKMPAWVELAYADYAKRLPSDYALHLKEIRPEPRNTGKTAAQIKALEAARIHMALPINSLTIVLDEHGQDITSVALAKLLKQWHQDNRTIAFVIGGADGLDSTIKEKSALSIRLSSMTLPHGMVRVFFVEQLYRAWSILNNHPYHRA